MNSIMHIKKEHDVFDIIMYVNGITELYRENKRDAAHKLIDRIFREISVLEPNTFLNNFLILIDVLRSLKDIEKSMELVVKAISIAEKRKMSPEILLRLKVEYIKTKLHKGGVSTRELDQLFDEFLTYSHENKDVVLLLSYATGIYAPVYVAYGEVEYAIEVLRDTLTTVNEIYGDVKPTEVLPYLAETLTFLAELEFEKGDYKNAMQHILWAARAFHSSNMREESLKALKNFIDLKLKYGNMNELKLVLYEFYDILDDELKNLLKKLEGDQRDIN